MCSVPLTVRSTRITLQLRTRFPTARCCSRGWMQGRAGTSNVLRGPIHGHLPLLWRAASPDPYATSALSVSYVVVFGSNDNAVSFHSHPPLPNRVIVIVIWHDAYLSNGERNIYTDTSKYQRLSAVRSAAIPVFVRREHLSYTSWSEGHTRYQ